MDELILLDPEEIPDFLSGNGSVFGGEILVRCAGIDVCIYKDYELSAICCDHPRHGCHPKFREQYAKVRALMEKLRGTSVDDGPCPKCEGKGWLATNSPEARHVVLLSLMMGMWRGISFRPRGLSSGSLGDTLGAFLPGVESGGASSSPVGVAAFDRALFNLKKVVGEEKGEGE